jgi:signal transduction histidine kinase
LGHWSCVSLVVFSAKRVRDPPNVASKRTLPVTRERDYSVHEERLPFDTLKLTLTAAVLGVVAIVAALRGMDLSARRERTLISAEQRAAGLARISSRYLREVFAVTDASLRQVAALGPRLGSPAVSSDEWTPILNAARAGLTGIGALTITDSDGVIRTSTFGAIVGQSRQDDYLFKRLSTTAADGLLAGTPFRTVTSGLSIPLGRRLLTSDGRFAGIVVATLLPGELRGFFKSVDVGHTGVVSVFHPEGLVLIREPSSSDPIGETAHGNPIFDASRDRSAGTLRGKLTQEGPLMISAFVATAEPALIVAVSFGQQEVLSEWRGEVGTSAALLLLMLLMSTAALMLLFRQIDARHRAQEQAAAAETARRVTETRAALAEELAHKNQELETFAYSVSHDLRGPLRGVDGFSQILVEDHADSLDDAARGYLTRIRAAAKRMGEMIDALLELSRIGRAQVRRQTVGLSEMARSVGDELLGREPGRHVAMTIDDHLSASADGRLIRIVLENLIGNAWKFTAQTAEARIEVGAVRRGSRLMYFVRDNGAGFDMAHADQLFLPFRRLHTDLDFPGTGIGLATVRRIVELHGGCVEAESTPGRGATFYFSVDSENVAGSNAGSGHEASDAPLRAG